ncbi:MAG: glycerol-3-phosphate 1-O-acyltransferase PlsY, partial [Clostridia bacterium]
YVAVIISAYLLGSLNFSIIISKAVMKTDVREHGSKNAGSTNAYRLMGGKMTTFVMLGDVLKGVIAVLIGGLVFGELAHFGGYGKLAAGFAVVLGHVFPVYFKFKGGKGVLTAAAMLAVFDVRVLAVVFAVFVIVVILTRFVSLASVFAAAGVPISMFIFYGADPVYLTAGFVLGAFVIFLHRGNIKRLIHGEESRFTLNKKGKDDKK